MKVTLGSNRTIKYVTRIGEIINSPEQRLILGATALATQPFIDLNNKKADKETRAVSVARTIGKIIAGTIVGVAVRAGSIAAIKRFSGAELKTIDGITKICKKTNKDIFVPLFAKIRPNISQADFAKEYKNYTNALGTVAATVAMIFTNFLIDVPLTKFITDKLTSKVQKSIDKKETGGTK